MDSLDRQQKVIFAYYIYNDKKHLQRRRVTENAEYRRKVRSFSRIKCKKF